MADTSLLLPVLTGIIVGCVLTFLLMRVAADRRGGSNDAGTLVANLKSQLSDRTEAHRSDITRLSDELRAKTKEAEDRGFAEGESRAIQRHRSFTLHVRPFIRERVDGSLLWKKSTVEVGSMYQLMVHGVPCFDPMYKTHETIEKLEANKDMIEAAKQIAIAGMHKFVIGQFGAHSGVITIDETPVVEELEKSDGKSAKVDEAKKTSR